MRKLVSLFLVFSLISISNSNAFFNRDCANLKKRTIANQKIYEKAWDRYQIAYGQWQAIDDVNEKWQSPEAVNRLKQTLQVAQKILLDLQKYPKCLKVSGANSIQIRTALVDIEKIYKDVNGNMGFALFNNYLPTAFDYLRYLK